MSLLGQTLREVLPGDAKRMPSVTESRRWGEMKETIWSLSSVYGAQMGETRVGPFRIHYRILCLYLGLVFTRASHRLPAASVTSHDRKLVKLHTCTYPKVCTL
jgi:hypothetical protein